jgi:hypothetical protein
MSIKEQLRIPVDAVVFREDLYPRIQTSAVTVQKYAEDLSVLPPIIVNQHNELIDGWHRWTAHRKAEATHIAVIVEPTTSDAHLLERAIETNATHGLQLSQEDKRSMARRIYHVTPDRERNAKKAQLASILSVSERTVARWLDRIDKDTKAERDRQIFDMWLSCHTQEDAAETVGIPQQTVSDRFTEFGQLSNLGKTDEANAQHATDFTPPIYNVWKQQEKTPGASHFGNSEARWVDNLLYLYTNPFDIVIDPFAGGGSTIDLCKKRLRRYWVSDRKPIVEREKEIRRHDLITADGEIALPDLRGRWGDVRLVYLDPPYWRQAQNRYSSDPTDLANVELEAFNRYLSGIINGFAKKLTNAYIALIIQPTQWSADDRRPVDHVADMLRLVKAPLLMRYSVPYESQQYNAQQVEWAKENKQCLILSREIVVWEVSA